MVAPEVYDAVLGAVLTAIKRLDLRYTYGNPEEGGRCEIHEILGILGRTVLLWPYFRVLSMTSACSLEPAAKESAKSLRSTRTSLYVIYAMHFVEKEGCCAHPTNLTPHTRTSTCCESL